MLGNVPTVFSVLCVDEPQAGVSENVHFQEFTFIPEAGQVFDQ